jgi:hypothetical protein
VTTREIPNGVAFELSTHIIGLERQTGRAVLVERGGGRPWRIDGYTIESSALGGPPRRNGEMHPDADEFLYLASGRVRVRLELEDGVRRPAPAAP